MRVEATKDGVRLTQRTRGPVAGARTPPTVALEPWIVVDPVTWGDPLLSRWAVDSDTRLYVAGGPTGLLATLKTAYRFDPIADAWTTLPLMITGRQEFGAICDQQGRFYAISGRPTQDLGAGLTALSERFDPLTNTWSAIASLPNARVGAKLVLDSQNRIYVIGGAGTSATVFYRYDVTLATWTALPATNARAGHITVIDSQDRVYAISGTTGPTVDRYNPLTNTWTALAPLPDGFQRSGAVGLIDATDRIYVISGSYAASRTATVYRFNGATWDTLPDIPLARTAAAGVFGEDGTIYVTGGTTGAILGGLATDIMERFDPVAGTWYFPERPDPMTSRRSGHIMWRDVEGDFYAVQGAIFGDVGGIERYRPARGAERGVSTVRPLSERLNAQPLA